MKYDFYNTLSQRSRERIIRAQQALYGKILSGFTFSSALEVGPGYGGFAEFCSCRRIDYVAVEANDRLAEPLRQKGHEVIAADIRFWQVPSIRRWDLVMLSHVLEHMDSYATAVEVLVKLIGVLTNNGLLVILCPDVRWSPKPFHIDPTHQVPTTLQSLVRMLGDLDMRILRQGHYVGRWLRGWRLLWAAHRVGPCWMLPDSLGASLDSLFSVNCHLVATPGESYQVDRQDLSGSMCSARTREDGNT